MSYDPSYRRPALKLYTARRRALTPINTRGREEWRIDQIVDAKIVKGKRMYKVRWLGYGEGDDTWETRHTLRDCEALARWDYAQKQVRAVVVGRNAIGCSLANSACYRIP
jgi:hypothetical protein